MHFIHKTLLGSFFALSPLSAAIAAEVLPVMSVTANLMETDVDKTLAAVTVIDREEIERKQFASLDDLLKTIPGVSYTNQGGMGKATTISIRGTNNRHVLVLVDGQKVGSATLGETAFEHFPIGQIERVEVVRGPRSSLYGSEAIGGVIQIFTRNGSENGIKPFASVTYGSHETYQGNVGVNIRQNDSWATLSLAGINTQGFNASNIMESYDLDRDGYKNKSASLRMGHKFNDQLDVDASVLRVSATNKYDSLDLPYDPDYRNPYANIEQNVYNFGVSYTPFNFLTTQFKLGRAEDRLNSHDNYASVINTQRDSLLWLNTVSINADHKLMLGFDYQNDQVSGTKTYAIKERDNKGYFAQYLGSFGALDAQGAIRLDDNQQFGSHTTGSATLGYHFNEMLQTYVSYGTAFKAPTFNDLYWPGSENPNLVPEESQNYEIGFKGLLQNINWTLNGFYNEIENMITWAPAPTVDDPYRWAPSNVEKALIKGLEFSLAQKIHNIDWNVNYTYQDPKNRTQGVNYGNQLNLRAKQLFNTSVDYTMGKWTVGSAVHAEGRRFANSDNSMVLGGFATVDARLTYQATPEFSIQAKLANLLDKEYSTSFANQTLYRQDGRTAWITLRYAMK